LNIQWYPGHMTKARRMIAGSLRLCDVICEVLDSRIPLSSRNPEIDELAREKPRVIVLNRSDQADPAETAAWSRFLGKDGSIVISTDSKSGRGVGRFPHAVREAAREKLSRAAAKGLNPTVRAMIVGIPNVGKSSLINRLTKSGRARTEDRPGVTRGKQWFSVGRNLELLDTPGILWPKFEDPKTGLLLAFTGAIRDEVVDIGELAAKLIGFLAKKYPDSVAARYKIEPVGDGHELLAAAAKKRGCITSGGEPDIERIAAIVLDEFRAGRLGCFTLESVSGADVDV
jgi:ribosome biogenesis GTPase A